MTEQVEAREAKSSKVADRENGEPDSATTEAAIDELEKKAIVAINTLLDIEQEIFQIRQRDEGKPHHQRAVALASALSQVENVRDDVLSSMPNARLTLS